MKYTSSSRNIVFLGTHIKGFNKPRIIAINNNETYDYQEQVMRKLTSISYQII